MYISEILEITNYRNLTGKRIKFNETLNFLIGENNIGKTNMLELINIFLSVGKFIESDFTDVMRPIRIRLRIKYSDEEVGYFEDKFKEEMSIFYVAITRAKKDVFFTVNTGVNKWNYVKTISCLLNLEGLTSEDYEWENVI